MRPLPNVELSFMQKALKMLGISSVSEEIQKAVYTICSEDYPLESEVCKDLTLKLLIGFNYNKSCVHAMHNPENGNSYFHKEYDTKGYLKFISRYNASRFIIEDLLEKLYVNAKNNTLELVYDLGNHQKRLYTVDVSSLRDACERSIKGCPSVPQDTYESVVIEQVIEFVSQYSQLCVDDIREFGFDKFDIPN